MANPLNPADPPRWRPAQAALSLMAVGALLGLPLLRVAPNRLVSGEAVSFFSLLQGPVWGLAALLTALLLLSLTPPRRVTLWLTVAAGTALVVGLGGLAASHATQVVQRRHAVCPHLAGQRPVAGLAADGPAAGRRAASTAGRHAGPPGRGHGGLAAAGTVAGQRRCRRVVHHEGIRQPQRRVLGRHCAPCADRGAGAVLHPGHRPAAGLGHPPLRAGRRMRCFRCSTSFKPFPRLRCLAC